MGLQQMSMAVRVSAMAMARTRRLCLEKAVGGGRADPLAGLWWGFSTLQICSVSVTR